MYLSAIEHVGHGDGRIVGTTAGESGNGHAWYAWRDNPWWELRTVDERQANGRSDTKDKTKSEENDFLPLWF